MIHKLIQILVLFTCCSIANAQKGDGKEPVDLLKSENWKEWGSDPIPVLSPEESLKTMQVAPGFKVELVAAEPLIKDPVFAEWDSQGRLWVCEFNTYMIDINGSDENKPVSRVVVLEDTDGDGRMDKSTPFLEDMINPRTLSLVDGGVLVVGSGKMWFCEDADGDLHCDKKTEVMEFAKSALINIEHAENGLHYAIDNWMYNSKSNRKVKWQNRKAVTTAAQDRGQWGMSTDTYGRLYYNHNSTWFVSDWAIYDQAWPVGKKTMDAPTKKVFPIHPTPALNRAYKPGMLNKQGNPEAVTDISGLAVHSNGAFGAEWEGVIFSFSPGTNTVGAFKPNQPFPNTTGYEHLVYGDDASGQSEFLASTDTRFRPVNGSFGPDGCLYIVDFYRGIIQHRNFLTSYLRNQSLVKELDKHIGLGRIYRVVPEGYKPVPAPTNLVEALSHKHLWWRLNAQKQIVEGNQTGLVEDIKKLTLDLKASPYARVQAMWTLAGLDKLDDQVVKAALGDDDWFLSMTGLRLAGATTTTPDVFPANYMENAKEIGSKKRPLLSTYAQTIAAKGYPSRVVITYKDKEAKWLEKDKKLQSQYRKGRGEYQISCGACHQLDGKGIANLAPGLAGSDWVKGGPIRSIAVALHGVTGPIKVNGKEVTGVPPIMPGHGFMKDEQIADILTYIRNAWGNHETAITAKEVADFRAAHSTRFLPWSSEELEALQPLK